MAGTFLSFPIVSFARLFCARCVLYVHTPSMTAAAGAALYRQGIIADSRMNAFASDEGALGYLEQLRQNLKEKK